MRRKYSAEMVPTIRSRVHDDEASVDRGCKVAVSKGLCIRVAPQTIRFLEDMDLVVGVL